MLAQFVYNQLDKSVSVYFEGKLWAKLPKGIIRHSFQRETTLEELKSYVEGLERRAAENYTVRLLALKSYLKEQLRRKLEERGFSEKLILELLEKYCRIGYLDDEKFLENLILKEKRKGYGRKMVFFKLRKLGFSSEKSQAALDHFYPFSEERKNLLFFQKKKGQKNSAYWLRRGFSNVFAFSFEEDG